MNRELPTIDRYGTLRFQSGPIFLAPVVVSPEPSTDELPQELADYMNRRECKSGPCQHAHNVRCKGLAKANLWLASTRRHAIVRARPTGLRCWQSTTTYQSTPPMALTSISTGHKPTSCEKCGLFRTLYHNSETDEWLCLPCIFQLRRNIQDRHGPAKAASADKGPTPIPLMRLGL